MPMPKELIAKDSVNIIHRLLTDRRPPQIYSLLRFPARTTQVSIPQIAARPNTERSRKNCLNMMLKTYEKIDQSTRGLSKEGFKKIVGRFDYNILTSDEQRN